MRLVFPLILLLLSGVLIPGVALCQELDEQDTVSMGILMRKERTYSLMLHTLGYGVGFRTGVNNNYFRRRIFEFDLLEIKAPNQEKTYNNNFLDPKYYYYGKLNNLYTFRAGIGNQVMLNRKPYWGGVEVRYFYSGGLSLGLAKPVYLYVSYYGPDFIIFATKTEKFDPEKQYPGTIDNDTSYDIYGRAPVFTGLSEIKPFPGLYLKGGFMFDFGVLNDRVKALEIGLVADFYPKGIPIMAFHDPYNFFLTAYFSVQFGKRFN